MNTEVIQIILTKVTEALTEIAAMNGAPDENPKEEPTITGPGSPRAIPAFNPAAVPPPKGVEVDSEGIPWDARIHTKAKTKLVKGNTWKLIRGVDPVLVAQVKTELALAHPAAAPSTVPPTPVDPRVSLPPLPAAGMTWAQLMDKIGAGAIDATIVQAACMKFGAPNITVLQDNQILVPLVAKELGLE